VLKKFYAGFEIYVVLNKMIMHFRFRCYIDARWHEITRTLRLVSVLYLLIQKSSIINQFILHIENMVLRIFLINKKIILNNCANACWKLHDHSFFTKRFLQIE
jgi:hypothetical protein